MGQPIYFTDPAVAAAYGVSPGNWVHIADDVEAQWLIDNRHGGTLAHPTALPAAGFVHPDAPLPFVPYPGPAPAPEPAPVPAPRMRAPAPRKAEGGAP